MLSKKSKHLITTSRYCSKWFRTLPNFVIFVFGFIEIKFLVLSKHALFIWACLLTVASNCMMTSYFLLLLCVFSCINFPFSFIILFLSFIWRKLDNIYFLVIMLLPCCTTPVLCFLVYFQFSPVNVLGFYYFVHRVSRNFPSNYVVVLPYHPSNSFAGWWGFTEHKEAEV